MSHEDYLTFHLLARMAERFGPTRRIGKKLPDLIEYIAEIDCPERPEKRAGTVWWNKIRQISRDLAQEPGGGEGEIVSRNCAVLGTYFGLSPVETSILTFVATYRIFVGFEHVVDTALESKDVTAPLLMAWFGEAKESQIRAALRPTGRLFEAGLLEAEYYGKIKFDLPDMLKKTLVSDVESLGDLISIMFPTAPPPQADWVDFEAMGPDARIIRDLVASALASRAQGVNILLYGPPGTGKTEFAKVLAREVGAELCAMGEAEVNNCAPSRNGRLLEMAMACRMLGARSDTILLFDEMEDLLDHDRAFSSSNSPSKIHMNRVLETNPLPVIWTTNSVSHCDPAFLRRMSYSVLMRPPSGRVRARIWQRLDARHEVGIPAASLPALAERHGEAPALVSDAMRVARLCGGGAEMVSQVLDAAARLARGGTEAAPNQISDAPWHPELVNTDADLALIEARLAAPGAPRRISFCLDGPAGSGKSAWARHLSRVIGMPVIQKRASDLISMWVGESEKNIARAFTEARSDGAMLIFDEADSLLSDRRGAQRNWEVSQVNEMLTWMESHPLPFVCTTNLVDKLDPATQRRFTFRIRFDYLAPDQLPQAWAAHFAASPPAGLSLCDRLVPGDFANVARRMSALGETCSQEILRELTREASAKEGASRPIGFVR